MKFQTSIKDHNKKITTLIAILGAILVLSNVFDNTAINISPYARTLTEASVGGDRPIMHTFYQEADEGEDALLEVWKSEWNRAGFDTKILTMEDARSHEYFAEMESVIKPKWGETYNGLCFYRWLAMATVEGGGWMSDFDVMPTNFPKEDLLSLPHEGNFTSFQYHVPSLVSGNQDEWLRVTKLLVEAIPKAGETYGLMTDMMAFFVLRDEGHYHIHFDYEMIKIYAYKEAKTVDCEAMCFGRAIHFSHKATDEAFHRGYFSTSSGTEEYVLPTGRAARISEFMEEWREQCQTEIAESLTRVE